MKRINTLLFTFLVILTSVLFLTTTANAQLVGGTTFPINGVENPPTSFNNLTSAVAYLTTNGVTGSGQVIMELASGYPGELAPVLIPSITGTNATLGITFRPATGTTITTSIPGAASPNQHAIRITGSYITLDGRAGGVGNTRDWTVRATGSGTTGLGQMAVRLDNTSNSMTGLVIRNLILEGEAANTTGAIFQITGGSTNTISNVTIEQNLIQSAATLRGYGITLATASNVGNTGIIVRNNVITQFYARGINLTGGFPGIEVYGNEIYHSAAVTQPTATEFSAFYFSTTASQGTKIYNNYVHDIQLSNGATAANGMYFFNGNTSGLPIEIFNNRVQIGNGITATTIPVYGIRDNAVSGALLNIYYNSILVDGSPSAGTSNSAAFRKEVSNFINLKNNIFYNARSNSGGTGVHWGISINNTTFASISNNDYFANGTGGVLGTTDGTLTGNKTTLSAWLAAVTSDVGSVSQNPNFVAGLKINESIATQLESGGVPIAGITTDFEGNPRSITTPDIGADEFNGILLDLVAPNIVVTPLFNQSNTTSVSLTASITDFSGIDTAANLPRMYLKKGVNGSWVFDSNPTINGSNYTFTINYSAVGGVVLADTIYYYLAAQDLLANAGTRPAGGSGSNPPGTVPPVTLYSYLIVDLPLSGTYTVGLNLFNQVTGKNVYSENRTRTVLRDLNGNDATNDYLGTLVTKENGGVINQTLTPNMVEVTEEYTVLMENGVPFDGSFYLTDRPLGIYPTITAAVSDMNARGISGPVTLSLVDAIYPSEIYPIVLQPVPGMSSVNTVTIKPAVGVNAEIPGSPTQTTSTIQVAGGDYYIIDGSNTVGGTTQNLKIASIAIGTIPTIHLFSAANNNIFKNLIVEGKNTSSASGSFLFGSGDPSNNNLIDNCIIKDVDSSATNHAVGLYFFSSIGYSNNTIQNSTIKNFSARGIYLRGAPATNLRVLNNTIYNTEISTATAIYGIQVDRCEGTIITGNKIYDVATSSISSSAVVGGLYFFGGSASGDLLFANNTISLGASLVTTTGIQRGIDYFAFSVNNFQAFYNTIFVGGAGVTDALQSSGIAKRDVANLFRMVDNIFYNERSNGTGTAKHYAISMDNTIATTLNLNYNDYFVIGTGGVLGKFGTNDITTLSTWRDSTLQDANTINSNPQFVADTDLRPGFLSPVLGAGTPVAGILTDILGVSRNVTSPTIGAYEQGVVAPLAGDYFIPKGSNTNGFDNLEDAIVALNTAGASGSVRFLIDDNLNEVGANLLITRNDLTATNNLTIKPAASKTPIITITGCTSTAGATQYSGLALSGASYVTFDGSNTQGGTTKDLTIAMNDSVNGRIGFTLFGNTDFIVFKNLNIKYNIINATSMTGRGIYANGQASGVADSLIIENCKIGDNTFSPAYSISITGSSGSLLYASKINIKNNELYGIMRSVYFFYGGLAGTTSEISGNVINSAYAPTPVNVVWGILFNTYAGTINIYNNKLNKLVSATTGTEGIYGIGTLNGVAGVVVNIYNNFIGGDFQHNGTGTPSGIDVISFQDNIAQANVYHNTLVLNNMTKTASSRMTGVRWGGTANVTLRNNIIINEKDATVAYALYSAGGTFTSNYNDLYVSGANANIGFSGVARKSFQTWQDSTGQDANSVNVSAPFAAPLDFHIPDGTVTSLESAGTPIALVTTDIDGQARNLSTPDIGADEFAGLLLINAPSNLTAVADTFAILLSWADNSTNELGFYIERKDGDSLSVNPFVVIDTVGVGVVSHNDLGRTPNTTYSYRVQAYNLLGVSPYSNVVTATTIVPVELTSFVANVGDRDITVIWSTATELNNRGFELERKLDAGWQKVTFIEGRGTTTQKSNYSYSDKFKYDGFQGIVQYRLKQIDFDGTSTYSNVISVEVDFTPKEYTLYQNYPNPFNPSTTIKFALPYESNVTITIYNLLGEQVDVIFDQVKEVGYHNVSWNAGDLASGVYMYSIEAKSVDGLKNYHTVKKMMLIK